MSGDPSFEVRKESLLIVGGVFGAVLLAFGVSMLAQHLHGPYDQAAPASKQVVCVGELPDAGTAMTLNCELGKGKK